MEINYIILSGTITDSDDFGGRMVCAVGVE